MSEADPWDDMEPISYRADGESKLLLIGKDVGEDGALRVAERARPWQPGVKLDETGPDGDRFQLQFCFHNNLEEPDVDNGKPMWPDVLEDLITQFKTGKTATLNLPWKRGLRVKPLTWSRKATSDRHRGGELLTANFKTDNEDTFDREAFVRPSVTSTLQQKVEAAVFDAESEGAYHPSMADIRQFASELTALIQSPSEQLTAVITTASQLHAAAAQVLNAPQDAHMSSPNGSLLRIRMYEIQDLARQASSDARSRQRRTSLYVPQRNTTIWRIAVEVGQDAEELIELNGDMEDLNDIPKDTLVRIYAD